MRHLSATILALLTALILPPVLSAQTVTWSATYPNSPQAGQVAGQGKATPGTNQTLTAVFLNATSATGTAGGAGGQVQCTVTGGVNFSGVVTGLPTGTYQVYPRMVYAQAGQMKFWDSPIIGSITVK